MLIVMETSFDFQRFHGCAPFVPYTQYIVSRMLILVLVQYRFLIRIGKGLTRKGKKLMGKLIKKEEERMGKLIKKEEERMGKLIKKNPKMKGTHNLET